MAISLTFQVEKLSPLSVEEIALGHTAGEWPSWDSNPVLSESRAHGLFICHMRKFLMRCLINNNNNSQQR